MHLLRYVAFNLIAVCLFNATVLGQTSPSPTPAPAPPPATDVFIADLSSSGDTLKIGAPRRITEWTGYDNQPSFTPDASALLYTSIRADNQADIYRYAFADNSTTRVTETAESEYSPTVTPDGKSISVVRVEKDGTQRLWKFSLTAGAQPSLVLENFKPVGYHAWGDERTLALFILGQPITLQIVDVRTGEWGVIATNVGRSLQRVPRTQKISYVHKLGEGDWAVRTYDVKTHAKQTLTKTLPGSEDYAWTSDGASILMAKDAKVFLWRAGATEWREIADFSNANLKSITRLSVSPKGDRIAFVAQASGDSR